VKPDALAPFEFAPWPVLLVDPVGVVRQFNSAAAAAFGDSLRQNDSVLQSVWFPQNSIRAEVFLAHIDDVSARLIQLKFRTKDGLYSQFTVCVAPLGRDARATVVLQLLPAVEAPAAPAPATKTEAADASLKQKFAIAMQLTRTVAMDFNNALTSILGHTSHVLGRLEAGSPWRASLLEVEKAAARAAAISHDLSNFSRQEKDASPQHEGNLNDAIRRATGAFRTPANCRIEWEVHLENHLYTARYDDTKLQNAFTKILENCVEALGGQHGRVRVVSLNRDLAAPVQDANITLPPGSYVSVEVSDTGPGIPADALPHVIEPFFTTKPGHRGLGLAWAYGVVTNHGGHLAISSEAGHGTSVRLYLPARKAVVFDATFNEEDFYGTQTILMVDDEDLLLTMGQMVLSSYGYTVHTADSGTKAIEIFAKVGPQIDLVITDLVMPNMSGRELVDRLRAMRPDVRIVRSSGNFRPSEVEADSIYLQKPFTSQDLLKIVKQALAA